MTGALVVARGLRRGMVPPTRASTRSALVHERRSMSTGRVDVLSGLIGGIPGKKIGGIVGVFASLAPRIFFCGAAASGLAGTRLSPTVAWCDDRDKEATCRVPRVSPDTLARRLAIHEERLAKETAGLAIVRSVMWRNAHRLAVGVVCALGVAVAQTRIPFLLGKLVNGIIGRLKEGPAGAGSVGISALLSGVHSSSILYALVAWYAVDAVLTFLMIENLALFGERTAEELKKRLFRSMLSQDIAFFDTQQSGSLLSRLTSDVQDFKHSLKSSISQGLRSITTFTASAVTLFTLSPHLALMVVSIAGVTVGAGTIFANHLRVLSKAANAQHAEASSIALELLSNVRTVRAFATEDEESDRFGSATSRAHRSSEKLQRHIGVFQGVSHLTVNLLVFLVLNAGGACVTSGAMTAGDLMSFLISTQACQRSLTSFSIAYGAGLKGRNAALSLSELIVREPAIPLADGLQLDPNQIRGHIRFENVKFAYPTRANQTVFPNLSLELPAGSIMALVGSSGAGKSTVAHLIEGFYIPDAGRIVIDGEHDLRSIDATWYRKNVVGMISQEPVLFATSILENIRYAKPDASVQEVWAAAEQANCREFIENMPDGLETVCGERGVALSGGQKQRIAIARVILKNPKILIVDEGTSSLDAESEFKVQQALDRLMKHRTTLVIAHRLSTIRHMNTIVVMHGGKVVETGTHAQLVQQKGRYHDLVARQNQDE